MNRSSRRDKVFRGDAVGRSSWWILLKCAGQAPDARCKIETDADFVESQDVEHRLRQAETPQRDQAMSQ